MSKIVKFLKRMNIDLVTSAVLDKMEEQICSKCLQSCNRCNFDYELELLRDEVSRSEYGLDVESLIY